MRKAESKTFTTRTLQGFRAAERYKARLDNKYQKVTVTVLGLDNVRVSGTNPIKEGQ
jgi:hypothetical protein